MFEGSALLNQICQPLLAYCGRSAELTLGPNSVQYFHGFNFSSLDSLFRYDIKISRFESRVFSEDCDSSFAYMVQCYVRSDNLLDIPFEDANVFFEKDFDDLLKYSIMLPRMFKEHHRYVLSMEGDNVCSFGDFAKKVALWKKTVGIT